MKTIFLIILWSVGMLGLILRVRAIGWFLILFGIFLIAILIAFLIIGIKFINILNFNSLKFNEILIFSLNNLFYLSFMIFQIDFSDISSYSVIEKWTKITWFKEKIEKNWIKILLINFFFLLISEVLLILSILNIHFL